MNAAQLVVLLVTFGGLLFTLWYRRRARRVEAARRELLRRERERERQREQECARAAARVYADGRHIGQLVSIRFTIDDHASGPLRRMQRALADMSRAMRHAERAK